MIGTLRSANSSIERRLDELDERVALLRVQWTGEASDAYDKAQREAQAQLAAMNGVLSRSHDAAVTVRDRHLAAAAAVEKLWA